MIPVWGKILGFFFRGAVSGNGEEDNHGGLSAQGRRKQGSHRGLPLLLLLQIIGQGAELFLGQVILRHGRALDQGLGVPEVVYHPPGVSPGSDVVEGGSDGSACPLELVARGAVIGGIELGALGRGGWGGCLLAGGESGFGCAFLAYGR